MLRIILPEYIHGIPREAYFIFPSTSAHDTNSNPVVDEKAGWSLAKHVKSFIAHNSAAHAALNNPEQAEANYISVSKALYKYLKVADFDPRFRIASGLKFSLRDVPVSLSEKLTDNPSMVHTIKQPLVQVNNLAFDLSYKRLGANYVNKWDMTESEMHQYFHHISENNSLVEMTQDSARELLKEFNEKEQVKNMGNVGKPIPTVNYIYTTRKKR